MDELNQAYNMLTEMTLCIHVDFVLLKFGLYFSNNNKNNN